MSGRKGAGPPLTREEKRAINRTDDLFEHVGFYRTGGSPALVLFLIFVVGLAFIGVAVMMFGELMRDHPGIVVVGLLVVFAIVFVVLLYQHQQKKRIEEALRDIDAGERSRRQGPRSQ